MRKHRKVSPILRLQKCFVQVGVTSTNGDLKGFIDQNQSPTKGKRILFDTYIKTYFTAMYDSHLGYSEFKCSKCISHIPTGSCSIPTCKCQ